MNKGSLLRAEWVPFDVLVLKETGKAYLLMDYVMPTLKVFEKPQSATGTTTITSLMAGLSVVEDQEYQSNQQAMRKEFWVPKSLVHPEGIPEMIVWALKRELPMTLYLPLWFCRQEGHKIKRTLPSEQVDRDARQSSWNWRIAREMLDVFEVAESQNTVPQKIVPQLYEIREANYWGNALPLVDTRNISVDPVKMVREDRERKIMERVREISAYESRYSMMSLQERQLQEDARRREIMRLSSIMPPSLERANPQEGKKPTQKPEREKKRAISLTDTYHEEE
jgi:hypothetical protein